MQALLSATMQPPEPAMESAAASASASVVTSMREAGSTFAEEPPGQKALIWRPSKGPPASSMITCVKGTPISIS